MDIALRDQFIELWKQYFNGAELPVCFFYTDDLRGQQPLAKPAAHLCMIGQLSRARRGQTLCFSAESFGCFGGKRYLGFTHEIMPDFEYFLSCGIPGKLEGERYKKSPQIVLETFKKQPRFEAAGKYVVFKRWDKLEPADEPAVAIFFASPDVLSGLFTLAGFDEIETEAVVAPFGAGCATIAQYPYLQGLSDHPRAVIGMFDVSARPFVESNILTFAAPMGKFVRMVQNMAESFLVTASWAKVHRRIVAQMRPRRPRRVGPSEHE